MDAPYFSTSLPSILLISYFIILTVLLPPSYCIGDDPLFVECGRPYRCGSFENISFPYWIDDDRPDYCGHRDKGYQLKCFNNEYPVLQFEELEFRVLNFNQPTSRMTIVRKDLMDNLCPVKKLTTALNYNLYGYTSTVQNLTLFYGCSQNVSIPAGNRFECRPGAWNNAYFVDYTLPPGINLSEFNQSCNATVKVPIFKTSALNEVPAVGAAQLLMKILEKGFEVEYDQSLLFACGGCRGSGGICSSNSTRTPPFVCFCPDGVQSPFLCPDGRKINRLKVMIRAFGKIPLHPSFFLRSIHNTCLDYFQNSNKSIWSCLVHISFNSFHNPSQGVASEHLLKYNFNRDIRFLYWKVLKTSNDGGNLCLPSFFFFFFLFFVFYLFHVLRKLYVCMLFTS
ncbi:hypothetical protein I3843_15G113600 [Carya illinoinensis]|nr:hypothetical protein I3843_15G113600 [Carya illinoinensis]